MACGGQEGVTYAPGDYPRKTKTTQSPKERWFCEGTPKRRKKFERHKAGRAGRVHCAGFCSGRASRMNGTWGKVPMDVRANGSCPPACTQLVGRHERENK